MTEEKPRSLLIEQIEHIMNLLNKDPTVQAYNKLRKFKETLENEE